MEPLEERVLLSGTIYVDASATGANTGTSWADAYTNLQSALGAASSGTSIDVAAGDYSPGPNPTDTFSLIDGLTLQGGFAAGGSAMPDPSVNVTKLDGGNVNYHVVSSNGNDATAVLNGFTITGGSANGSANPDYDGGGILVVSGSPTITDCIISNNAASVYGGGMFNDSPNFDNASQPLVTDCTFTQNTAGDGGGMSNYYASPTLNQCAFVQNSAGTGGGAYDGPYCYATLTGCAFDGNTATSGGGGGMRNISNSAPMLTNCAFSQNTASGSQDGGGMDNTNVSPAILYNCIFTNNSAYNGGGMENDNSAPSVTDCLFSQNSASQGGGAMYNYESASPAVTDCAFVLNTATYEGGGMRNEVSCSPAVTNCIFVQNSAGEGGGIYEFLSSPTLTNCTFSGNMAPSSVGGGMYNNVSSSPSLTNCIFWGDTAHMDNEISNSSSIPTITYSDIEGGYSGAGNINADPMFADVANGDTQLLPGSPCIDVGSNAALPSGDIIDLAGNPRIVNGTVDMGAYEFQTPFTWTGDGDGINWNDPSNWLVDQVPDPSSQVIIGPGFANVQVPSGAFAAGTITASSPLEILSGATLTIYDPSTFNSSLTVDSGGTLDITNASITINYGTATDPITAIVSDLTTGYNSGSWTGTGITSSTAAANPGGGTVGYLDGATDMGSLAASGQIVVKYTLPGDSNLDGVVNFADLLAIAQHFGGTGNDWFGGNINYASDGVVNFSDLLVVAQNFGSSLPAATVSVAGDSAPVASPPASTTTAVAKPNVVIVDPPPQSGPAKALPGGNQIDSQLLSGWDDPLGGKRPEISL